MSIIERADGSDIQQAGVGSVGELGITPASFNRYRLTSPWGVSIGMEEIQQTISIAQSAISRGRKMGGEGGEEMTRGVGKFLMLEHNLEEVLQSPYTRDRLEVLVPTSLVYSGLGEHQRAWLAIFAVNHPSRTTIEDRERMMRRVDTERLYNHDVSPVGRVMMLQSAGYHFIDSMCGREHEILELWEKTFGWDSQGVQARRDVIEEQSNWSASQRNSWFSGIVDPAGDLVAASVAERLNLPTLAGNDLPIVELSEWRRSDKAQRLGLMAADNVYLIAQVLQDLAHVSPEPLLFAETNYMSSAHRVGFASGMDIPIIPYENTRVPQILVQNVSVGDGYEPAGLRDFTFMYVPEGSTRNLYSEANRVAILGWERAFQGRQI